MNPINQLVDGGQTVTAAAVAAGGSGYAVGNTITLANGVVLTVATLSVSAVATVTITNAGSIASGATAPANPQAQVSTNGTGTGATFNLTWSYTVGPFTPIALDWLQSPFNATVATYLHGTATYGMDYTLDNIMTTPPGSVRWVADPAIPAGTTSNQVQTLNTPKFAIRLNVAAMSAPIEFKVLQGTR